jgi:predicted amidophosphoribosyltransferase
MQCPQCQHENPQHAKFCNECATPLAPCCPSCEVENPPGAKFCHQCATPLTGTASAPGLAQLATEPEPQTYHVAPKPGPIAAVGLQRLTWDRF